MTHHELIAKIEEECASNLGYAMRGVSSWDQEYMRFWKTKPSLSRDEMARLCEIETQVFGYSALTYDG